MLRCVGSLQSFGSRTWTLCNGVGFARESSLPSDKNCFPFYKEPQSFSTSSGDRCLRISSSFTLSAALSQNRPVGPPARKRRRRRSGEEEEEEDEEEEEEEEEKGKLSLCSRLRGLLPHLPKTQTPRLPSAACLRLVRACPFSRGLIKPSPKT